MIGENGISHHLMSGSDSVQTVHPYPVTGAEPLQESSERPCEGSKWELLIAFALR